MSKTNGDYISVPEAMKRTGRSDAFIYAAIKNKTVKSKLIKRPHPLTHRVIEQKMVQLSDLASLGNGTRKIRGPYKPRTFASHSQPDLTNAPQDLDLSELEDFTVERGKHSFKALSAAIALTVQRKSWDEIEQTTGVPRPVIIPLIRECKDAFADDPKKYPTVMAYLLAGRPFHPKNRNLLEKPKKK